MRKITIFRLISALFSLIFPQSDLAGGKSAASNYNSPLYLFITFKIYRDIAIEISDTATPYRYLRARLQPAGSPLEGGRTDCAWRYLPVSAYRHGELRPQ